jgi:hypothetical protein
MMISNALFLAFVVSIIAISFMPRQALGSPHNQVRETRPPHLGAGFLLRSPLDGVETHTTLDLLVHGYRILTAGPC